MNIMVIFYHHYNNIIAALLGLETLLPSKKLRFTKTVHTTKNAVHWYHAEADMIYPSLDITDSLNVVVGKGVWYFIIIKYLALFRSFPFSLHSL